MSGHDPAGHSALEVDRLTKRFGGLLALDQVSFVIARGEVVGLIGPNGAGKTTLFNVISGFEPPTAGRVIFQ
ncbi:MAG TPA: ATP-binding cassette domain-containing protein, partial [Candidatus Acidoferrum sp.]|nr:ATP-binding cassette domain-containing protein [Candidatus Acidoferrum sp.]